MAEFRVLHGQVYVLESLLEPGDTLAANGVVPHVLDAGDFGEVAMVLEAFVRTQGITHVYRNREYPMNELRRDRAVADPACREGAECWLGELAWRDSYRQIMHCFPALARGHPFRPETDLLPWSHGREHFDAWCEGRTGYPLVDAAKDNWDQYGRGL